MAPRRNTGLRNVFLKKERDGFHIDAEYQGKTINYGPFRTKERAMRMREAVIESELQRNPGDDAEPAIEKYKQFHRYDPKKIETVDLEIPTRVKKLGAAKDVLYRSAKVDPATLKKPKRPVDYIHAFNAGVLAYTCSGRADTDVPGEFIDIEALVFLGKCLGVSLRDGIEAQGADPLPDLCCSPDGKCLLVIQSKRKVLTMFWGGNLGVHPRGIDG